MEFNLAATLEILSRTPAALDSLLGGLSDVWIHPNEGEGSWSAYDIVGHLIHGEEENWMPRAQAILRDGEGKPFAPFDRVAMFERSQGKSMPELLDRFRELRGESLTELRRMNPTPEMLDRRGTHPELGSVTLAQLLSTWTVHDLGHLGQIARVMAKQYGEAVGPWRAYLPILGR